MSSTNCRQTETIDSTVAKKGGKKEEVKADMGVNVSNHETISILTIDRPPVNALDGETMAALSDALDAAMQDDAIRVVVVTGAGEKTFAAGADLEELQACDTAAGRALVTRVKAAMAKLRQGPKPVIAAINGLAAGGGLELAMACDIRIADPTAGLGLPEVTLGVIPGAGGTQMLPRLIGMGRALEMMLTGTIIGADQGMAMGLIDGVAEPGGALNQAMKLAGKIARNAPLAMAEIKAAAYATFSQPLEQGFVLETEGFARLCITEDKSEGIDAFKSRRRPVYHGR
jgi:enoyl-CoA hydratase